MSDFSKITQKMTVKSKCQGTLFPEFSHLPILLSSGKVTQLLRSELESPWATTVNNRTITDLRSRTMMQHAFSCSGHSTCISQRMEWLSLWLLWLTTLYLLVFQFNKYSSGKALLGTGHSEMNKVQCLPSRNSDISVTPCLAQDSSLLCRDLTPPVTFYRNPIRLLPVTHKMEAR